MTLDDNEMLVPGFEPGSTDRESVMMGRATPHEPSNSPTYLRYINQVASIVSKVIEPQMCVGVSFVLLERKESGFDVG